MTRNATPEQFDIACLRHIATSAEVRRVSLAAAMIKLNALAIARSEPAVRSQALDIVEHLRELYPGLPERASLSRLLADHPVSGRLGPDAREALVEAVWEFFREGAIPAGASS